MMYLAQPQQTGNDSQQSVEVQQNDDLSKIINDYISDIKQKLSIKNDHQELETQNKQLQGTIKDITQNAQNTINNINNNRRLLKNDKNKIIAEHKRMLRNDFKNIFSFIKNNISTQRKTLELEGMAPLEYVRIEELLNKIEEFDNLIKEGDKKIPMIRKKLQKKTEERNTLRKDLQKLKSQLSGNKKKLQYIQKPTDNQGISTVQTNIDKINKDIDEKNKDIDEKNKEIKKYSKDIKSLDENNKKYKRNTQTLQTTINEEKNNQIKATLNTLDYYKYFWENIVQNIIKKATLQYTKTMNKGKLTQDLKKQKKVSEMFNLFLTNNNELKNAILTQDQNDNKFQIKSFVKQYKDISRYCTISDEFLKKIDGKPITEAMAEIVYYIAKHIQEMLC